MFSEYLSLWYTWRRKKINSFFEDKERFKLKLNIGGKESFVGTQHFKFSSQ